MPNTKSAKKRLKQSSVRRAKNRSTKSSLKTHIRRVTDAIAAGNAETTTTEFRLATKKLDQAASKNVIHANQAARLKSRLSARVKAATAKAK